MAFFVTWSVALLVDLMVALMVALKVVIGVAFVVALVMALVLAAFCPNFIKIGSVEEALALSKYYVSCCCYYFFNVLTRFKAKSLTYQQAQLGLDKLKSDKFN